MRWVGGIALVGAALGLAGCGEMSPLDPASPQAEGIADLWWWMMAAAWVVFIGAVGLLGIAYLRRHKPGLPLIGERENVNVGLVLTFGVAIPAVALIALFIVGNFVVAEGTNAPDPDTTPVTIEVTGHQWFWEVEYPGTTAVTANEIHIPARTRVNVVVRSDDVIHSFWVPRLNRKIDMIPGHTNRILLYANEPGRYRGQCAELCGIQHAHMAFAVIAQPPEEFRAWLEEMAAPAVPPDAPEERRGQQVFLDNCGVCHTIRGTRADGEIGPDLTHLQMRETLAALTIPNTEGHLAGWVLDPQSVKPGNKMPGLNLEGPEFQELMAYLESLE